MQILHLCLSAQRQLHVFFAHLFNYTSCRLAALVLYCHSVVLYTCNSDICADAICHLETFI